MQIAILVLSCISRKKKIISVYLAIKVAFLRKSGALFFKQTNVLEESFYGLSSLLAMKMGNTEMMVGEQEMEAEEEEKERALQLLLLLLSP